MRSSTTSTSTEMARIDLQVGPSSQERTWRRSVLAGALCLLLSLPAFGQMASPSEERAQLVAFFKERFPQVVAHRAAPDRKSVV